jgi:transcriptional regulator with XRE-family HTH domain
LATARPSKRGGVATYAQPASRVNIGAAVATAMNGRCTQPKNVAGGLHGEFARMSSGGQSNLRSMPCNGELLRYFREKRGWTQDELATRAGYSKRVVAKAEAGGSLESVTVEVLAEALSAVGDLVHPDDLLASPKALAERYVETFRRYEHELAARCRDFLADDMICIVGGDDRSVPLSGAYVGPDGFDCYCRKFFEIFERCDKDLYRPTIIAEGNHVMVAGREAIRLKGFPREPEEPPGWIVQDMLFSRGKLVRLELMFDTTGFGKALTRWREFQKTQHA